MIRRGELWWASLRKPRGSEPGYRRPVLVVQADSFNRSKISTVVCAIVTSNMNLAMAPGNVRLSRRQSGLSRESVINVSQLVTLDKRYLKERIGIVPARVMEEVDRGLRIVLSLP